MTRTADLVYNPNRSRGVLDVMVPDGDGPFPVVVCIHGGAWIGGDKEAMRPYAEWLLRMGIATVLPNYTFVSTAPHPAQQDSIFAALDWTAAHAAEFRLDPRRVGLTGASAGGHLAALCGARGSMLPGTRWTIRCMYPVCAPTEMYSWLRDARDDIRVYLEPLIGGKIEENDAAMRDVSPATYVYEGSPACRMAHGADDVLVPPSQSTAFIDALRCSGVEADAVIAPGVGHSMFNSNAEPFTEPLGGLDPFRAFFRKHLLDG